jgi:hypothetical protein
MKCNLKVMYHCKIHGNIQFCKFLVIEEGEEKDVILLTKFTPLTSNESRISQLFLG